MMKKWISGLMALVLLLCTACSSNNDNGIAVPAGIYADITGIDPITTVMEVDGNQIPAELYYYWVAYNCSSMDYDLNMAFAYGGLYSEMFDETGTLNWDAEFADGLTLSQYALGQAEDTAKFYATLENMAKEYGVELTEDDQAAMEENIAAIQEQYAGEEAFLENLELMGISLNTFKRISSATYLYNHLMDLVLEEGSPLYLEDEGYLSRFVYADHILLTTTDLSEEEAAAKLEAAEDLLAQLQAADDLPTLFAQLADKNSEDPGRASYPDGYTFGRGEMVQEFEDAAYAMEPGELSGIVETTYGYHILLRKDLLEKLEADPDVKTQMAGDYLSELLEEKMEAAAVKKDAAVEGLDAGAFYQSYTEAVEARQAEKEAENNTDGSTDGTDASGGADE